MTAWIPEVHHNAILLAGLDVAHSDEAAFMSHYERINEQLFSDEVKHLQTLSQAIEKEIKEILGITCKVRLVEPKTIARNEGKAKRVIDRRESR